jgi:hypothetical protein
LHEALRQLATAQKKAASEVRIQTREAAKDVRVEAIQRIVSKVWTTQAKDTASIPPPIEFVEDDKPAKRRSGSYVYRRSAVTGRKQAPRTNSERARTEILEEKLRAIAQVLASFNLIDRLTKTDQDALLLAIYKILEEQEE